MAASADFSLRAALKMLRDGTRSAVALSKSTSSRHWRSLLQAMSRQSSVGTRPAELPIHKHCCQSCGSAQIRRAHREGVRDKLRSLAGSYPYHCHQCRARFFLYAESLPRSTQPTTIQPARPRPERKRSDARRTQRLIALLVVCVALFALVLYFLIFPQPVDPSSV